SPYAVSKLAGEHYSRVWAELFGLETVALRYFNVYGPRQRPDSAYAAVIPLFTTALRTGARPIVHGDGGQSRSFTYIDDVVAANLAAAEAPAEACSGKAYNIAGSSVHTLLELLDERAKTSKAIRPIPKVAAGANAEPASGADRAHVKPRSFDPGRGADPGR